jgi:predicted aspartyl protease
MAIAEQSGRLGELIDPGRDSCLIISPENFREMGQPSATDDVIVNIAEITKLH